MLYRSILFIPYVLASVVTATIWKNLLNPQQGIGAADNMTWCWIDVFGSRLILGRTESALMSIAFIDNWQFWGFLMILFLAAMQSIPPVLYDAAKIDGANRWAGVPPCHLAGHQTDLALHVYDGGDLFLPGI